MVLKLFHFQKGKQKGLKVAVILWMDDGERDIKNVYVLLFTDAKKIENVVNSNSSDNKTEIEKKWVSYFLHMKFL